MATIIARLDEVIPIPNTHLNQGLSSPGQTFMIAKFGMPGNLTAQCSAPSAAMQHRVKHANVGPFAVSGFSAAVDSLERIFDKVRLHDPALFGSARTEGMLCVRHKRHNPNSFSNHSWGCAVDIFYGAHVVPQGSHTTNRGNLMLVPFFNAEGWFWGGGFSGGSVDSMHFELAKETIEKIVL